MSIQTKYQFIQKGQWHLYLYFEDKLVTTIYINLPDIRRHFKSKQTDIELNDWYIFFSEYGLDISELIPDIVLNNAELEQVKGAIKEIVILDNEKDWKPST